MTSGRPVDQWVKADSGDSSHYLTNGVGRPEDVPLEPFFRVVQQPYIVYWDLLTPEQWKDKRRDYEVQQKRYAEKAERTVDMFAIGEMQAERDHNVQGDKTNAGEFNGHKFRHAIDGGWFSFDVALPVEGAADLVVTYWGDETGDRSFKILLDDQDLAAESLQPDRPGAFWDRVYPLPLAATSGRKRAKVTFQANPGNVAGGVFGVRVVRRIKSLPQPCSAPGASC